ncbi:hypothetical protein HRR83_002437 [Exophiala dermatitidis]|uniref:ZN622/Rei1/Reh1 zinc finger C2H2-type domain-containing protein n=2 Tax=Exophiala dermatitidis TaxID=5970 RepID=H6C0V4_EXODN|nr:uncharacterized protein HMPREF1120_04560 [Exophiala dermatitidis NIH/UT8656]KAJ4524317.1 hypothetical protein HRR74_002515 [Exophiala dermatitidis]EHY56478.1 hypothetical protein HMPREF1120_04560 [Exophiala dermatitidis NIH/UT8656]KAJ4525411.1 hypothetical protein HRR73_002140 [Exophiala dermatitidis]KAJ4536726.1 hypothetical protein HRR76_004752 [Exophiala dermatitidis]KAJ4555671.1 hypothetical protein HRR77_001601 [Exophiala dermatitidis]
MPLGGNSITTTSTDTSIAMATVEVSSVITTTATGSMTTLELLDSTGGDIFTRSDRGEISNTANTDEDGFNHTITESSPSPSIAATISTTADLSRRDVLNGRIPNAADDNEDSFSFSFSFSFNNTVPPDSSPSPSLTSIVDDNHDHDTAPAATVDNDSDVDVDEDYKNDVDENENQYGNGDYNDSSNSNSSQYQYQYLSQCLFCNIPHSSLDDNLIHMSKTHGFQIVDHPANLLLVDVSTLLTYFHSLIFDCFECLYCGTQRHSCQAVQQHMRDKGHCKYDLENNDEVREFYEVQDDNLPHRHDQSSTSPTLREDRSTRGPRRRVRRGRQPSRRADARSQANRRIESVVGTQISRPPPTPSHSVLGWGGLCLVPRTSTKALKQKSMLSNLRADDRASLMHLPTSQQKALLATQHKQMEQASRKEQTDRTRLESAANRFGCLGKIRLVRKPPHTGNVHSLKR